MLGMNYAATANTSGMHGEVPAEAARGFNWGAFFLGWIWLMGMRMTAAGAALLFVPMVIGGVIGGIIGGSAVTGGNASSVNTLLLPFRIILALAQFGIAIYLGLNGNRLAWRNRRFDSVEDFKACQRIWGWWGLGLFLAGIALFVLLVVVIFVGVAASMGTGGAGRPKI